jgi:SAM-dependent methyltransferase
VRVSEPTVDERNAEFWNELCGTSLARKVGVTGRTPEDLRRFDEAYFDFYPYLRDYLPADLSGRRVLEIGLGYGTLGQEIAGRGARYTGLDVSPGPVEMMRHRLELIGATTSDARLGSALDLPFADGEVDVVVSIGCLHHTGDLPGAVAEVRRVLRAGGHAVVMVYNAWSARRVLRAPRTYFASRLRRRDGDAAVRALYDHNTEGTAAPHTDFLSTREVRDLFSDFSRVEVDRRNLSFRFLPMLRRPALRMRLDGVGGLDLYVRAVK